MVITGSKRSIYSMGNKTKLNSTWTKIPLNGRNKMKSEPPEQNLIPFIPKKEKRNLLFH